MGELERQKKQKNRFAGTAFSKFGMEFQTSERLEIQAKIPHMGKTAKLSVRSDYDKSFRVKAAQLGTGGNWEIGDFSFKLDFADSWSSTPTANNNSLLS